MPKVFRGIALILRCPMREFLLVRDLVSKDILEKPAGALGPPMETIEEGETPDDRMAYLISEELGIGNHYAVYPWQWISTPVRHRYGNRNQAIIHVAYADVRGQFRACPEDPTVAHAGWYCERRIREAEHGKLLRVETMPVLAHYQRHVLAA